MGGSRNNQRKGKKPVKPTESGFGSNSKSLFKRLSTSNSTPPQRSISALGQTSVASEPTLDPLTSYGLRKEASKSAPALVDRPDSLAQDSSLVASVSGSRSSNPGCYKPESLLVEAVTPSDVMLGGSMSPTQPPQPAVPIILVSTSTSSTQPKNLDKLKTILKLKLEKEEYEKVVSQTANVPTNAQNNAKSLVATLRAKANAEVPKRRKGTRERALVFLEKVAKIGDAAIQHHPDIVALAWAGFRTLLQVAIDNMELKKLLETAEEVIFTALEVCQFYEEIYVSPGGKEKPVATVNLEDAMIELYAAIIIFCIKSEKYIKRSGILSSVINTFTAVNTELQTLVSDVEAKGRLLQRWAELANTEDHRRRFEQLQSNMRSMREEIQNDLTKIVTVLSDLLNSQQKEGLRKSRIWLGALESDSEYERNLKLRTPGTCEWILKHPGFMSWLNGTASASILVIYGIPGAGKSVLQSFIRQKLEQGSSTISSFNQHPPILHFFFKNGNRKTESPITMLATLIDQLIQQHKSLHFLKLLNEARESSNSKKCGSFKQLSTLFRNFMDIYDTNDGPVSILIDALDECTDREILCDFLNYIASQKNDLKRFGVRFLLTSRPEDYIMRVLEVGEQCSSINLKSELVTEDIKHFVEKQIAPGTIGYEKLRLFREMLIEILPPKSQGMFRYAALMLDQLLKPTTRDVKKTLNSIPSGLNNMYVWMLEHFNNDPDELLLRQTVFTWVAMAFRPLTVYELALAYAACDEDDDGDSEFNPSTKSLINEQDIYRACGTFVEILSSSKYLLTGESSPTSRYRIVSFSHFSVKEFLLLNLKKSDQDVLLNKGPLVKEFLIPSASVAHKTVLRACMTQLLSCSFLRNSNNADLPSYTVRYWFEHARDAQSDNDLASETKAQDSDWQAVCKFMSQSNPSFVAWWEQFPKNELSLLDTCLFLYSRQDYKQTPNALHIMACFNLYQPFLEVIYSNTFDMDLQYKDIRIRNTALYFAASLGHVCMVQLLFLMGAGVEIEDEYGETPLSLASKKGHTEVVKLLLANGADTNSGDENRGTPLSLASENGHTEIVKLLLANGADVASKGSLFLASVRGHTEVVKLLLANGADVDRKYYSRGTPLLSASKRGHTEVVKVLLANDADMESKNRREQTPLVLASKEGHTEVVKFLLANGADVESKKNWRTPLIWASMKGHTEVAKLLLANGADVESKGGSGRTPLMFASEGGHTEVVKLLLANGADVESEDESEQTPLIWASMKGHTVEVVKLLLANSANMESKDICGQTPLMFASKEGHTQVTKLLLANGADAESKDVDGRTALSLAAGNCYPEIVRLLLESGANMSAKDNNGQTPAAWAAEIPNFYRDRSILLKLLGDYSSQTTSELMDQKEK